MILPGLLDQVLFFSRMNQMFCRKNKCMRPVSAQTHMKCPLRMWEISSCVLPDWKCTQKILVHHYDQLFFLCSIEGLQTLESGHDEYWRIGPLSPYWLIDISVYWQGTLLYKDLLLFLGNVKILMNIPNSKLSHCQKGDGSLNVNTFGLFVFRRSQQHKSKSCQPRLVSK